MGIYRSINGFDRDTNYGPLAFDRTHLFSATYVFQTPSFFKRDANTIAGGLANGWVLSGVFQAYSGANLAANREGNFKLNAANLTSGRPVNNLSVVGANAIQAQPLVTCDPRSNLQDGQYVNGSCFAAPVPGVNGQLGINGPTILPYFRGPGYFKTDMSLFKEFCNFGKE